MTAPIYGVTAAAVVSLGAAGTPVTVLAVTSHANSGIQLVGFDLGFLGITATEVPPLVEFCQWSGATAGTATGAATITQESGLTLAAGFTANYDYTAEPTVLTPFRKFPLTANGGTVLYDVPLGSEPQAGLSPLGIVMRVTPTATGQTLWPTMRIQRI